MDVRLRIALASKTVNVSGFCREYGISRETFHFWRRRFEAEGLDGLEPRSRAPKTSPQRTDPAVEDAIVALRKQLAEENLDAGPATIQWHLGRQGCPRVPSEATIWRVLVRRGFVDSEPRKRPKSSYRRFEATAPNELWQADATDWVVATGPVKILNFLDDHSRVALRSRAVIEATSEATWDTFCQATERWGVPVGQLTDNGLNFSGKLRGFEVHFEKQLRAIGVVPKTSRPYHPQTCGKVERFQQTLKKWLRRQPLAADVADLQAQLDRFVDYYNHQRPHAGIGRVIPAERWAATPPAINLGLALPSPTRHANTAVAANGVIELSRWQINVGARWAGRAARVDLDDTHFAVFIDHQLVRAGALNTTRRYQGLTGRRNKRHLP